MTFLGGTRKEISTKNKAQKVSVDSTHTCEREKASKFEVLFYQPIISAPITTNPLPSHIVGSASFFFRYRLNFQQWGPSTVLFRSAFHHYWSVDTTSRLSKSSVMKNDSKLLTLFLIIACSISLIIRKLHFKSLRHLNPLLTGCCIDTQNAVLATLP